MTRKQKNSAFQCTLYVCHTVSVNDIQYWTIGHYRGDNIND